MKPIALFDLDSTLADYVLAMMRDLCAIAAPGEEIVLDKEHTKATPHLKARRDMIRARPGWWRELPRCDLGWDVLDMAKRAGFTCQILSKVPRESPLAAAEKLQWCEEHAPGLDVTFVTHKDKSHVLGDVLVDDWPAYFMPWLYRHETGAVVVPARPWNEEAKHERLLRYRGPGDGEALARIFVEQLARCGLRAPEPATRW